MPFLDIVVLTKVPYKLGLSVVLDLGGGLCKNTKGIWCFSEVVALYLL
jgi:hypothetical protein